MVSKFKSFSSLLVVAVATCMALVFAGPAQASAAQAPRPAASSALGYTQVNKAATVAKETARFAGCLGGFGFVATPIVVGFVFGGPPGAVAAAKGWIPRLGIVGTTVLKWCMRSVLGVRM